MTMITMARLISEWTWLREICTRDWPEQEN